VNSKGNPNDVDLLELLEQVQRGEVSPQEVANKVRRFGGFEASEHATTDLDRSRRRGIPEVIYGAGKTAPQIIEILKVLVSAEQYGLVTRLDAEKAHEVLAVFPKATYDTQARCLKVGSSLDGVESLGKIAVISAGTSDLSIAAETCFCLNVFGNSVDEYRDLGVSGLHRLLSIIPRLRSCQAVITIAGFEAALPTVLSGLLDRPIIAVPTSVGYGASFGGVTALLGMLSSCAPGITVVNIDNGFGAAYAATLMNRRPIAQ
jgi:pyridinium-3,5-biscarboxylic acid mononucleotide synthase